MRSSLQFRRAVTTLALVVAALAAAPVAHAGPIVDTATDCDDQVVEFPFKPWIDPAPYVLLPNGHVEGSREWQLAGEAAVALGNEWFYVHGAHEVWSLALPPGSWAASAPVCVGIEHPTLRLFVRNDGSSSSTLLVEVLFETADGQVRAQNIGSVLGGPGWVPTPPLPVTVNLLPFLPQNRTAIAFRFTTVGEGDWRIDDVYVDPWRHG
jgi:hypothetical protein